MSEKVKTLILVSQWNGGYQIYSAKEVISSKNSAQYLLNILILPKLDVICWGWIC